VSERAAAESSNCKSSLLSIINLPAAAEPNDVDNVDGLSDRGRYPTTYHIPYHGSLHPGPRPTSTPCNSTYLPTYLPTYRFHFTFLFRFTDPIFLAFKLINTGQRELKPIRFTVNYPGYKYACFYLILYIQRAFLHLDSGFRILDRSGGGVGVCRLLGKVRKGAA
jgi:hypothetical protein